MQVAKSIDNSNIVYTITGATGTIQASLSADTQTNITSKIVNGVLTLAKSEVFSISSAILLIIKDEAKNSYYSELLLNGEPLEPKLSLNSINGDGYDDITIPSSNVRNRIYSKDGKWYFERNIGKIVLDGSVDEVWGYKDYPTAIRFYCNVPIGAKIYTGRIPVYADGYHFGTENEDKMIFLSNATGYLRIYVYNYKYTNINSFRAYLSAKPLEVYYELAEPVVTEFEYSDIIRPEFLDLSTDGNSGSGDIYEYNDGFVQGLLTGLVVDRKL